MTCYTRQLNNFIDSATAGQEFYLQLNFILTETRSNMKKNAFGNFVRKVGFDTLASWRGQPCQNCGCMDRGGKKQRQWDQGLYSVSSVACPVVHRSLPAESNKIPPSDQVLYSIISRTPAHPATQLPREAGSVIALLVWTKA